ncbi:hypothetical protein DICSQDRAFT_127376 [Dichomitus squalens LYAD-421 SS1]|uniref:Uncharacterized protein n=1 Tax=Dichomitus squalens (strain LYAD-421) TaxID=732165 RepID=R7SY11_DICSQ|nr:uncharacterized protein DICSQDRAFT_127376 [Dichomitus squalens LYAD-421 SS1]EJF61059.1 hypothetical protein DICSQDRAFT_127376 [Dichomitus squalens LYAD-421 SS1]
MGAVRHDQGHKIHTNVSSTYKPVGRSARRFTSLKLPKKLQASLLYVSKPALMKVQYRATYMQKRAVVMEPEEKKAMALLQQAIHTLFRLQCSSFLMATREEVPMSSGDSHTMHEIHHADSPYTTNDPASQLSQSSQWSQTTQSRALRKEGSGGGAWNVPVAHITMTETSGQTYGFALKTSDDRYIRLADEANRWILGPMPPMAFIDEFLSLDEVGVKGYMPSPAGAFDAVPTEGAKEEDFYEPLARAINAAGRCPGFTFCDTHLHEDTSDPSEGKAGHVKPDVCGYANEHLDRIETPALKQARTRGTGDAEGGPNGASITEDQGDSPASGMRRSARGGARSGSSKRGRVVHTGPHERGSAGGDGRLPEWESHGVRPPVPASAPANQPVTVPVKRTDMGYAALVVEVKATSHEDVFCDPSSPDSDRNKWSFITQSNSKEARRRLEQVTEFRSAVEKHIAQQGVISRNFYARDALKEHFDEQSVTAIHLPDSPYFEQDGHYLLVSRPMSVPLSVTGRGTRTYWAVDSRTKQVQLLKDTWRYDVGQYRQETEGQILRALSAITKHVPPVMHEEDVLKSVVVADDLQDGQLLEIQYTSALKSAYDVEKRLHRDITPGNIILYRDIDSESESEKRHAKRCRRGYLIDWELSRKCEHGSSHSTNVEDLPVSMFDYWFCYADGGAPSGGVHKATNLLDQTYTGRLEWATPAIQQWISKALDYCTWREDHVSPLEAFYEWYGNFLEAQQGSKISERNDNTKVEVIKHVFKSKKPLTALNKPVHQSTTPAASSSASRRINKRPLEDDTEIPSTGNSDGPPAPKRARKGGETILRPPAWNYHSYRSTSHTMSSSTSLTVPGGDASISGDDMDDYSPYGVAGSSSRDLGIEWDGTL